jgi:hypothetical protein
MAQIRLGNFIKYPQRTIQTSIYAFLDMNLSTKHIEIPFFQRFFQRSLSWIRFSVILSQPAAQT